MLARSTAEPAEPDVKTAPPIAVTLRWLSAALLAVTLAGCATRPAAPVADRDATGGQGLRQQLVATAARQIGRPYRYGGADPRGFDCSGLVQYAHVQVGVAVPRTTADLWRAARPVARNRRQPGDLVFFAIDDGKGDHVGIYAGDGYFIHAPSPGKRVGRARVDNPYWRQRLVGTRSFL